MLRSCSGAAGALWLASRHPQTRASLQAASWGAGTPAPQQGPDTASCSGRQQAPWWGQRWQSTASVGAAAEEASPSHGLTIHESAIKRLRELQADAPDRPLLLRIEVEGGGCSGFQYVFRLDSAMAEDDRVFEKGGVKVVCDPVSLGFLEGAVIEYEDSLMRSAFQIASNPNAEASCGCGSSFAAKI